MATPSIYQPPPPPPPPAAKSNLPMLYYGLIVVGTAAIVLALYNIIVIRLCSDRRSQLPQPRPNSSLIEVSRTSLRARFEDRALPSSFKYKKEKAAMTAAAATAEADSECAVCLSAFEEGEEIRNLPRCKHSFHAPCIDMWLYSHSDCPLCRAPVVVSGAGRCHRHVMSPPEENSIEVLLNTTVTV